MAGLGATMRVDSVEEKPGTRRPSPPFMTSTLQQEASRKLRWGGQRTMRVRAGALRARLHHLHAYRLHDAVGDRRSARPARRPRRCTARITSPRSRGPTTARSRTPRRRTRRFGPLVTPSAPPGRWPAS
ncbi:MAG: hypothetical protein V9G10_04580 [Candidatus Nanopelagicales bacterium]